MLTVKQIEAAKPKENHTAFSMVMACTFMSLYPGKGMAASLQD